MTGKSPDLFGYEEPARYPARPGFVRDSDTSREAADSVEQHVSELCGRVLAVIGRSDGATCDEVEATLDLRHQTASARIREMFLAGKIRDGCERRLTRSGRRATVWVLV